MRTRRKFLPWLESWRRGSFIRGSRSWHPGCSPCGWERRGFAASSLGAVAMGSAESPGQPSFCPHFFACSVCFGSLLIYFFLHPSSSRRKGRNGKSSATPFGQSQNASCSSSQHLWEQRQCSNAHFTAPGTQHCRKRNPLWCWREKCAWL